VPGTATDPSASIATGYRSIRPREEKSHGDRCEGGTSFASRPRVQIRFDRGTILLDPSSTKNDLQTIPGVTQDPRDGSWRVPADAYGSLLLRMSDNNVCLTDNIPDHRTDTTNWSLPELRWYQREALSAWIASGRRGVVALPTGAGKTILAAATIATCGLSALCLVPTRVLLEQWTRVIDRFMPDPGRIGDGERRVAPVTVATYASAVTWAPRIGGKFGLIIVDEAHHVGASCPIEILEMLVASARLGLTATPPDAGSGSLLERHVGPVVYSLGIDDLVGDALADFDLITIPIRLTPPERSSYRAARATFSKAYSSYQRAVPGATWATFVASALRSEEGRRALAGWRTSRELLAYPQDKRRVVRELLTRHASSKTLIFTQDTRTAYDIASEFLVYPITHEIGRSERELALSRFKSGEINVMVSAQVLDEGLDVPEAEIAIIVGGSSSSRRYVQRIGRVLRPAPGKRARVYELAVGESIEEDYVHKRREGISRATAERRP
jgi:superfamily II DNA or RNA helicase